MMKWKINMKDSIYELKKVKEKEAGQKSIEK